jgi:hypothetical protein
MRRLKSKKLFKSTKSKAILLVVLVFLLGASAWAINNISNSGNPKNTNTGGQTPNGASPNLNPATAQEKAANDAHKDALIQQQNSPGSAKGNDSGKSAVITSADNSAVRALVSGVVEDNGTCTFVFTQGSNTITKTSAGVANASTTICALLSPAPSSFLGKGGWNVALNYTSSTSSVKSSAYSFEVK